MKLDNLKEKIIKIKNYDLIKKFNNLIEQYAANIILLSSIIFFIFISNLNTFPVKGHIDDFFQLTNSGYEFNKLKLHTDFHSSLGLIYHIIQYLSLQIVLLFKLNIIAMIFISSFLFFFIIFAVFLLINVNRQIKIPKTILLFLFYLVFNLNVHFKLSFDPYLMLSATYNIYLHAFIIFQACYIIYYLNNIDNFNNIRYPAFINAIFLYITFHFKINFFLASCILSAILFLFFDIKNKIKYAKYLIIFFLISIFITFIFNYDYINYFKDILEAAKARKHSWSNSNLSREIFYSLLYSIAASVIYLFKKDRFDKIKKFKAIYILFFILSIISLKICIRGDSLNPTIYYFYSLLAILIIFTEKRNDLLKMIINIILLYLIILFMIQKYKFFRFATLHNKRNLFYLELKNRDNIKFNMIYNQEHNSEFADKILNTNFEENEIFRFTFDFQLLKNFASKNDFTDPYLGTKIYGNYLKIINNALQDNLISRNAKIHIISTHNAASFYGYKVPKPFYHWFDRGNSISSEKIQHFLYNNFLDSDIVILPTFGLCGAEETLMNCIFYDFNRENNKFKLWKINKFAVFYVDKIFIKKNNLKLYTKFKEPSDMQKICKNLINFKLKNNFNTSEVDSNK